MSADSKPVPPGTPPPSPPPDPPHPPTGPGRLSTDPPPPPDPLPIPDPPNPRPRPHPGMTLPISGTRTPLPSLTAATVEGAGAGPLSRRGFTLPPTVDFQIGTATMRKLAAASVSLSLHRRGR